MVSGKINCTASSWQEHTYGRVLFRFDPRNAKAKRHALCKNLRTKRIREPHDASQATAPLGAASIYRLSLRSPTAFTGVVVSAVRVSRLL
jgi:hypothetical protein